MEQQRNDLRLGLFFAFILSIAACQSEPPQTTFDDLPDGDIDRGAALFVESVNDTPTCASCHSVDGGSGVGPTLQGYKEVASGRVDDQSAGEYTYLSIIRPSSHVVRGFSNVMYSEYESNLSVQQIADIMAYILEL